jgi:hypothetical protein
MFMEMALVSDALRPFPLIFFAPNLQLYPQTSKNAHKIPMGLCLSGTVAVNFTHNH